MIESGEYPEGAEYTKDAPWNEKINKPIKVNVAVSITLSKEVEVEVDDFGIDDEGCIDFSCCDLKAAVREQIYLPDEAGDNIEYLNELSDRGEDITRLSDNMIKDLKYWNTDDFEVVKDD